MFLFSFMISHKTINGWVITLLCSPPRPSCSSSPHHGAITKRSLYANVMDLMIIRTWHVRRQVRARPKAVQKLEGRCCHLMHEHFQETLGMWTEPCKEWLRYTAYTGLEMVMQSSLLFNSRFLTVIVEHELSAAMKNEKVMGEVTPKSRLDEGKEEHLCHISPPGKC